MPHFRSAVLATVFVLVQTLIIHAQEATSAVSADEVLTECLASDAGQLEISICFGKALENCEKRFPDAAVVPKKCWEEEHAIWDRLLISTFDALIADLKQRDYAEFEAPVVESHRHWLVQKDMDCRLEVSANPRTYDVIWTACQAEAKMQRIQFLRELMGADWTEF